MTKKQKEANKFSSNESGSSDTGEGSGDSSSSGSASIDSRTPYPGFAPTSFKYLTQDSKPVSLQSIIFSQD